MPQTWTGRTGWTLTCDGTRLTLAADGRTETFDGLEAARIGVSRLGPRRALTVAATDDAPARRLPGLTGRDASEITEAVARIVTRGKLRGALLLAAERRPYFERLLATRVRKQRWIAHDDAAAILAGLPRHADVLALLTPAERGGLETLLSPEERTALAFLAQDHLAQVSRANDEILRRELATGRPFFARVEKSPLTEEQARAVISHDNRVRVIAAAGSGKTSVMVARAAYAIRRGFVRPERVLMLAFNADAAKELQERVDSRLGALGLPHAGLKASTFHSFGLALIGEATGRKPRIAPWVEGGRDVEKVQEIVDRLRDQDLDFRFKWDLFRLLYGKVSAAADGGEPDSYDPTAKRAGFGTYRGETVRSEDERLVADWLFLHGVDYRYDEPYPRNVADHAHGRYRASFHYPAAGVWHEHWSVRADGSPVEDVRGYGDVMAWKRKVHADHGTALVETAWHSIMDHSGFEALARDLERHGVALDWNPDRPLPGAEPLEHERLARLMRTFMSHVKSGAVTRESLRDRVAANPAFDTARTRLFVDLYWRIHDAWQSELEATRTVDFDDMLLQAAALVEHDPRLARWDLVMVDEFQDTSRARARLTKALLRDRGTHLLAVGDDWQAINRFAGADLSVMTDFAAYFGPALTRRLQTTFRTTQTTADVAGRFVSRNPAQITKSVRSARGAGGAPVTVVRVARHDAVPAAVEAHLARLSASSRPAAAGRTTVDVLGRYGFDQKLVPARRFDGLDVRFRTVHRSKGLEADHIVLPNVTSGTYGFPSTIPDDPVLTLAMADGDAYRHAEERRLLYVALTRARQTVTLVTVTGRESPFVLELLEDPDVEVVDADGVPAGEVRVCPGCGEGTLVRRDGRYGEFYGCSTFPRCHETARV
ncbi:UvrD-helicase domain-containing protein [Demequina mangrovi]|uniref:DNA 3'-5' helicase n=1 Tax=Demequina mangrovi TaxID=1043493 RepID=A0A1H6UFB1_9MICO|nr:UvrD-helicase domain-containing protein [Demequina mangrovi]SEI91009.1 DNA helicase-4 [Demequina mangrovi]